MAGAKVLRKDGMQVLEYDWGRIEWYASAEIGNSAGLTFGKCIIRPGGANPGHFHPGCEEVLHVLEGKILHYMDGAEPVEMSPGDTITLPVGLAHSAGNAGDADAVLMVAFSSAERKMVKRPLSGS